MGHVITLAARPNNAPLTPVHLELVQHLLKKEGAGGLKPKWLESRKAAEIRFVGIESDRALELANEALVGTALDIGVIPEEDRKKN